MQDEKQRYDTLIVGAGMSGLAAGVRLAQAGRRVALLERHSLWGGLNSFYKLGGRRFDTGLHALTNYFAAGEKRTPLARVLRALRIERSELELGEQSWSHVSSRLGHEIVRLRFSNDLELFRTEIAARFPAQVDAFERLLADLPGYDSPRQSEPGARAELARRIRDPLLAEMLLCPEGVQIVSPGENKLRFFPGDEFRHHIPLRSPFCHLAYRTSFPRGRLL